MQNPTSSSDGELSIEQLDLVVGGTGSPFAIDGMDALGLHNFSSYFGAATPSQLGAGMLGRGGGNIVAAGGGNIVAAGGGNIVAAGGGN